MRTDSERKSVCLRRPNPARKSRGARLDVTWINNSLSVSDYYRDAEASFY